MKRWNIAVVLSAAVLLTGCANAIPGTAMVGEQPVVPTSDTFDVPTSEPAEPTDPSEPVEPTQESPKPTPTKESTSASSLDEDSAAWFSAFCSSVTPFLEVEQIETEAAEADSAELLQGIYLDGYGVIAVGLAASADELESLTAPSVPGGPEGAAAYVEGLRGVATDLTAGLESFAQADPTDLEAFKASALAALEPIKRLPAVLGEVDQMKLTVQQQKAILVLPNCIPVAEYVEGAGS